MKVGWLFLKLR